MAKPLVAIILTAVVGLGFARALTFGDAQPAQHPAPRSHPAAPSPPLAQAALVVSVTPDGLTVRPTRIRHSRAPLSVRVDNLAGQMVEVVVARAHGARLPTTTAALEFEREALLTVGTGEHAQHTLPLTPGRYAIAARPLTEGDVPPARPFGIAALRVKQ